MQMTLDSNTGCYEMADVNMYYLYPMSCRGGGKISVRGLRGGASFQRADAERGQVFSAPESRNSSAPPVPINNDRSLKIEGEGGGPSYLKRLKRTTDSELPQTFDFIPYPYSTGSLQRRFKL